MSSKQSLPTTGNFLRYKYSPRWIAIVVKTNLVLFFDEDGDFDELGVGRVYVQKPSEDDYVEYIIS